jgi:hypothetical protein
MDFLEFLLDNIPKIVWEQWEVCKYYMISYFVKNLLLNACHCKETASECLPCASTATNNIMQIPQSCIPDFQRLAARPPLGLKVLIFRCLLLTLV